MAGGGPTPANFPQIFQDVVKKLSKASPRVVDQQPHQI